MGIAILKYKKKTFIFSFLQYNTPEQYYFFKIAQEGRI